MADTKISALSAGTAAPGDEIPVNRSGSNFKITAGDILKIDGGTITADSPVLDLTQTWNNAAVTFTGLKFNATDTTSASGSMLMDLQVGGTSKFSVDKNAVIRDATSWRWSTNNSGVILGDEVFTVTRGTSVQPTFIVSSASGTFRIGMAQLTGFGWSSAGATATLDLSLFRDDAGTLAQRNAANAQTFRIYNTYTDASNYERGKFSWSSNVLQIGTESAGTGSARAIEFQAGGATRLTINTNGTISAGGAWNGSGDVRAGAASYFYFDARTRIQSPSDGVATLLNNAQSDFGRLQFGGTTSSFPALKRNSAALNVRLADDSADANLTAAALTLSGNLTISTKDIVTDTTTGTKIGTGTTQKLAFWNATPVVQPTAVADATDNATAITQLNALLGHMRTLGLIAT